MMLVGGLDVGRFNDRTALVALDEDVVTEAHLLANLPFREQCAILQRLVAPYELTLVDVTGLGIGLYEQLREAGCRVRPATLGAQYARPMVRYGDRVRVGKLHLIGRVATEIHERKITVAPWCCHRDELQRELGQLSIGYTPRGRISVAARSGHDDLAVALGLAILARDLRGRCNGQAQAAA